MLFVENNLPKPLDDKEIVEYFIRFQNGDLKSRESIINHNIRLVLYRVTTKFSSYSYDMDELVSIGLLGLIRAIDTFDINKEVKFSTYAMKCIDNEILLFIRKNKTRKKHISLTSPISTNKDGSELFLKDILRDSDEDFVSSIEEKELYDEVRRVIENLSEREKQIIMLYFGFNFEPLNQNEISSQMKISQSYVSKIITATLKTIKLQLENNEFQNKRRLKPIYEYFSDFSKEEIDNMLSQLNENEKELVRMRYGDDLEHPVTDPSWTRENNYIFYRSLVPKMKRLLKNTTKPIYKNRKLKTIYELFSDFSKDEIDNMLFQLNGDEKELVKMRYGDDLEHPVTDPSWTRENNYIFYRSLVPKMKRLLKNTTKPIYKNRKLKTIYELFSYFSKEEIDNMLSQLNEDEKELVRMRYGNDLEHPVTDSSWSRENYSVFYRSLIPKMKRLLKNAAKPVHKGRKLKSIYEYFSDFSKEEIDNMLFQLNDDEKELIRLRYGDDLEHPSTDPSWSKENIYSFYSILISKMKRKLQNKRKCDETNKEKCDNNYYEGEPNLTLSLEDYKKIKKLINASYIDSLANNLSISTVETMIILLKSMILNGKKLSNETIANLLEIDVNDVESTISKITEMSDNDDEFSMKLKFN